VAGAGNPFTQGGATVGGPADVGAQEAVAPGSPFVPGRGTGDRPRTASGNATDSLLGTRAAFGYSDLQGGPFQFTGNPLDVALSRNAFLMGTAPTGRLFTRSGTLRLGLGNQLQTAGGSPSAARAGPSPSPRGRCASP
jgi:hypothetical protein